MCVSGHGCVQGILLLETGFEPGLVFAPDTDGGGHGEGDARKQALAATDLFWMGLGLRPTV